MEAILNANQPLNLLILGGSGFVSGTLARTAVAQGHKVTVVTRGKRPLPSNVAAINADRRERAAFAQAIAQSKQSWDLVVDCIFALNRKMGTSSDDRRSP